jgi:hypothetical protein
MAVSVDPKAAVRVESVRRGMVPLWTDAEKCWCVSDHWFYRLEYATGRLNKVFRLPRRSGSLASRLRDWFARSSLRQRLQPRASIHHLVELPSGHLLVIYDRLYLYSPMDNGRHAMPLNASLQPPLAWPLRGGIAVHPSSACAYFGEYNDDPRGGRVVRVDARAGTVDVCWRFDRSEIRHVHAIHYDKFRHRLWICTGDRDHESAFYYTDDEFQTVHRFAGGDQSWRAIVMLFDEFGMEWGMDAGQDAPAEAINRIYRFDFASGQRTERAVIGNPAYAALTLDDGTAVMQTSFEPQRKQDTPAETALWRRKPDGHWALMMRLPFQAHVPCGVGRYGHLLLPVGRGPAGQVMCTPVNTASQALTLLRVCWKH